MTTKAAASRQILNSALLPAFYGVIFFKEILFVHLFRSDLLEFSFVLWSVIVAFLGQTQLLFK